MRSAVEDEHSVFLLDLLSQATVAHSPGTPGELEVAERPE